MAAAMQTVISHTAQMALLERNLLHFAKRSFYQYAPEPFHPFPHRTPQWKTAEEAVDVIQSGHKVFVHGVVGTPIKLIEAMTEHGARAGLKNVELIHIITQGDAIYNKPEYEGIFRSNSLFTAANCREAVNAGRADYTPIFLSETPLLFRRKIIQLDVALVSVTPPDKHGFCSLGPSVVCSRAALQNAKYIIGLVNDQLPKTFGDGIVHQSHLDVMVEGNDPLPEIEPPTLSEAEKKIGKIVAENLIQDGATLQMGVGSVPQAVLNELHCHRDLGIHSELISDGIIDLVDNGAITNAKKVIQTGKILSSFAMGSKRLYDFVHNNPFVVMADVSFTNNTSIICQNPRVTAINSCIEIDLTGQVCADSIGPNIYSGVGGQIDFIRGAALGLDGLGKPIIGMTSRTKNGESRIVPFLKEGSGVVTTRAHVHYIVTEFGIAYLFGKNLRQRAHELIKVAHPDDQSALEQAAYKRLKCMPSA